MKPMRHSIFLNYHILFMSGNIELFRFVCLLENALEFFHLCQ